MNKSRSRVALWIAFWLEQIADILFPPFCLGCGRAEAWICAECERSFALLPFGWCGLCGRSGLSDQTMCATCLRSLGLAGLVGCFVYQGRLERCIRTIKFHPAAIGIDALAALKVFDERSSVAAKTVLVPIPCNRANEKRRGFNQAERIARHIQNRNGDVLLLDHLRMTRSGRAQVGFTARERKANATKLYEWSGEPLNGCQCLLIDDVCTTGATLADAARALRASGARGVRAFVVAQTPRSRD